jgi:hypothetical protein
MGGRDRKKSKNASMKHKLIAENQRAGEEEVTVIPDHCWYDSFDNEYDNECGGQSLLHDYLEEPPECSVQEY